MRLILFLFCLFISHFSIAQTQILDSGGALMPEQAAYNVHFYELTLAIEPDEKSIEGSLSIEAEVVHPMYWLVLDLDTLLEVRQVKMMGKALPFERKVGKIWIDLGRTFQPGEQVATTISYGGQPRVAPRAPWDGGFTWAKTASGAHWIATTCQKQGADLWWPCKDHVSDEPDSMRLHITVPADLFVASNGTLENETKNENATKTYHWKISNPINIYNVALNIAPYKKIEEAFECMTGETYPFVFYVLPEDYEKGVKIFPEFKEHMAFFEKYFGPYPFRAEKYGVVQTPHLGMEHQSIIAYGANFDNKSMTRGVDWGFDALHHHELSHEWWGNLVTCDDWRDAWIHEGFGTYTQALFMEEKFGQDKYVAYMRSMRRFSNERAIAPRTSKTSVEGWLAPIYPKGAWILHTLRHVMGDDAFFKALRLMAYPDPAMETITDGTQTHFSSTDEFLQICKKVSGKELDWYFELYLRQPSLPTLTIDQREKGKLLLSWELPIEDISFLMTVPVQINGKIQMFNPDENGKMSIAVRAEDEVLIDPDSWILMERKLVE